MITERSYTNYGLARNSYTSPELLEELSYDKDEGVRWEVADNLSTPVHVLMRLAKDSHPRVRWTVAVNWNTPVESLVELASDKSYDVRHGVLDNPHTPPLVRLFLQSGGYQGMTLEEFLEAAAAHV